MKLYLRCFFGMILMLPLAMVHAEDVVFEFSFDKKPPKLALIYAIDGASNKISEVNIDQINKEFDAPAYVVNSSTKTLFKNSDQIDHNIFSKQKGSWSGFDIGLLNPGSESLSKVDFPTEKFVRLKCKIHPKMRTYVAEIPTNMYQILDIKKDGLQEAYNLKVDSNTTKVGLLIPGYEKIEFDLSHNEIEKKIFKKDKEKGSVKVIKI